MVCSRRRHVRRLWTSQEVARLLSLRSAGKSYEACAAALHRTRSQIGHKLRYLNVTRRIASRGKRLFEIRWTAKEVNTARTLYATHTAAEVAQRLGRTVSAVIVQLQGIAKRNKCCPWRYDDVVCVLECVSTATLRLEPQRTRDAIRYKRYVLRKLFRRGCLDRYLATLPGAPRKKCLKFGGCLPLGLKFSGIRLTAKAKVARADVYVAREAERERQKAAFKNGRSRCSRASRDG